MHEMAACLRRVMRNAAMALAVSLAAASASAAEAAPFPDIQSIAAPDELDVLADLNDIMVDQTGSGEEALAAAEGLLARLRRPTPLRGMIQFMRGSALFDLYRFDAARDAMEEAIRLLPDYSGPLLIAAEIELYSDRPLPAISYLIRASRIDPDMVRGVSDHEIDGLLQRTDEDAHRSQVARLAERLFEIGWRGERLPLRSRVAFYVIEERLKTGDTSGAKALLPHMADPRHIRRLLMQKRYEAFWPVLEEWAGPRQERLWPAYLKELQERWRASGDQIQGGDYVRAMMSAGRFEEIVTEFLPLFDAPDAKADYDILWIAAPLGRALAHLGRWDEMEAMYDRALRTWPIGSGANALNLSANRGRMRYVRGDFAGAVADLRASIDDAAKRQGEVNFRAVQEMHFTLACSLHASGRAAEAIASTAAVHGNGDPTLLAQLYSCLDRRERARDILLRALDREEQRSEVIGFLQLPEEPAFDTRIDRSKMERLAALRADPTLLTALEKHGRILPDPPGAGARKTGDDAKAKQGVPL